jgi:hypothetical protein
MNPVAKLVAFAAVLAAVFALAFAAGDAIDPDSRATSAQPAHQSGPEQGGGGSGHRDP